MNFLQATNLRCMCDHKGCCENNKIRDMALEEAAKVADEAERMWKLAKTDRMDDQAFIAKTLADAIRALKDK